MNLLIKTPELCEKCQYSATGDYCQEADCFECKNRYYLKVLRNPNDGLPKCKCELIKYNDPCPYYKKKPKGETK